MKHKKLPLQLVACICLVILICTLVFGQSTKARKSTSPRTKRKMVILQPPKVTFHFSDALAEQLKAENPECEVFPVSAVAMADTTVGSTTKKAGTKSYGKVLKADRCFVCDEWDCKDNGPPTRTVCCQCKRGHYVDCE